MLTGNKGEWSEVYTLLKIISDKQLYAGNSDLNKIENLIFPIIKILRDEPRKTFEFSYSNDLVIIKGNKEKYRLPLSKFHKYSTLLLSKLKQKTPRTFAIPEIENFLNSFDSQCLKAKSSVKSDIRIVIHDHRTGIMPELGFSIKSQLGGASTLLNAGKTTNFIFKINGGLSQNEIDNINSINTRTKIKDRIEKIINLSKSLSFDKTENPIFGNNLTLIDSSLPLIISELVYLFFTSKNTKLIDLVSGLSDLNPMQFNSNTDHPFYTYKIKRFLTDIALGMMPSKVWAGQIDATGGYLVVKNNGDILCYHIYNRNEFEDYLLYNTKLETASSSKHDFGYVYTEKGNIFFKLNLQIRFIK